MVFALRRALSMKSQLSPSLEMLRDDHDRVRALGRRFAAANHPYERRAIAQEIFIELEIHALIEERLIYPLLAQRASTADLVTEAVHEHREVKNRVALAKIVAVGDADFTVSVQEILAAVEHHATEEEQEMFPHAQAALGEKLDALRPEMEALERILSQPKSKRLAA
jgi:hemerythrin superfamily protein